MGTDAARDAVIEAMLPLVETEGWTQDVLRRVAGPQATALFSGRAADLVEAYSDLADRWMLRDAETAGLGGLRVSQRVRSVIALRLARNQPFKAAVRRGLAVLASPGNAATGLRCTARTLDAVWQAAGDRSADFSWYTKRVSLAALYGGTLLHWLQDADPASSSTLAFLDRGLAGIGRVGQARQRLRNRFAASRQA